LAKYNAIINVDKSSFSQKTINFVGHSISADVVRPLDSNVRALQEILPPTNTKLLSSFIGTANYYLKFVPHFSEISEPLTRLLKADVPFEWTLQCQAAFEKLKSSVASRPVLAHFDVECKTFVYVDASGIALGACLSQLQRGKERPVAFALRTLSADERAYSAI
jgi:hypothetical protein